MREFPKAWAESGSALLAAGAAPLDPGLMDPDVPVAVSLIDVADDRVPHAPARADDHQPVHWSRYWSVVSTAAAGWATLAIAYCPWHLVPQSLSELGIVMFGAVAGGAGALVMLMHPEERP